MKSYLPTKRFLRLTTGVYTIVIMTHDRDRLQLWCPHLINLVKKSIITIYVYWEWSSNNLFWFCVMMVTMKVSL